MQLPISYKDDRTTAEKILLAAAQRETVEISEIAAPMLKDLEERFLLKPIDLALAHIGGSPITGWNSRSAFWCAIMTLRVEGPHEPLHYR